THKPEFIMPQTETEGNVTAHSPEEERLRSKAAELAAIGMERGKAFTMLVKDPEFAGLQDRIAGILQRLEWFLPVARSAAPSNMPNMPLSQAVNHALHGIHETHAKQEKQSQHDKHVEQAEILRRLTTPDSQTAKQAGQATHAKQANQVGVSAEELLA